MLFGTYSVMEFAMKFVVWLADNAPFKNVVNGIPLLFRLLTPLHLAADKSHYDIMDVLLKHGAKVNALDGLGQTALHRSSREGNVQACRILLMYGVDPLVVSLQGYTAVQVATEGIQKMLTGQLNGLQGSQWSRISWKNILFFFS